MLPDVSVLVSNIAIANCFKTGRYDESDRRYYEFQILVTSWKLIEQVRCQVQLTVVLG